MSDFAKLARKLGTDGPVNTMSTTRKVQILFGGTWIVQTTNAVFVWEHPYYPQFYILFDDLSSSAKANGSRLTEVESFKSSDGKTTFATQYRIELSTGKSTDRILVFSKDLSDTAAPLKNLVKIEFDAMDQWLEEDTPIHVHPKNPFTRIDMLQSSRTIRVSVNGHQIAKTDFAMHLYETGLPCRYYMPLTAFDVKVLRPSNTRTKCPYKGEAEYYSVEVGGETHDDLVWYYRNPTLESGPIVGLLCPYNERVDIEIDGVKLETPKTVFTGRKPGEKPQTE